MNLLLDTNILIPLEPGSAADIERNSAPAVQLANLAQEVGASLFFHPKQSHDLAGDKDADRRELRRLLFKKYRELVNPPPLTQRVSEAAARPAEMSNSWIDAHLIAAIDQNAVSYLISEDKGIHRICHKIGIASRCLSLRAALDLLESERIVFPAAPPAIKSVLAYQLDGSDPVFGDLRADYRGFDAWLDKCKREQRHAWIVQLPGFPTYAGVCIVNPEEKLWPGCRPPSLKICTFKIVRDATGSKLGELLLRAVFDYAHKNGFSTLFIESFAKQVALLHLLDQFGFDVVEEKATSGEFILRKRMAPVEPEDHALPSLPFARSFGPFSVSRSITEAFAVPIEPRFHALLFPEMEAQGSLLPGSNSFGNTMLKAYLCRAQIRSLRAGALVFFYRSQDLQAFTTAGVVETVLVTGDADKMSAFLHKRTVYRREDIRGICASGEALGFTFRHAPILSAPIPLSELLRERVLSGAPQSITTLNSSSLSWLFHRP